MPCNANILILFSDIYKKIKVFYDAKKYFNQIQKYKGSLFEI